MSPVKDDYQEIRPVPLRLLEESVTSSLYCSLVKGIGDQVSALVEAFLVEVYRCRVCQFTSSAKDGISTHLLESHEVGGTSGPVLSCLDKDERECLGVDVGMRVDGEDNDMDQDGSPYNLEDDLHSASKDADNHMDHMGLDRMSFFLPLYGMLPNISPRSCEMGQGSNSDGSLHVAQTCEVSTLFQEEEEEEGHGDEDDEESIFQLEEDVSVDLSCPIDSVVHGPENQDEEMAQSAHLMTLGLCRISTAKPPPTAQPETPGDTKPALAPASQLAGECSDNSPDNKTSQQPLLRPFTSQKCPDRERPLTCTVCHAVLASERLLEVHVKCHDGERGFRCPGCGWRAGGWREMELHWRAHGRRRRRQRERTKERTKERTRERTRERRSRHYSCQICLRTFRTIESCDAHRQKHVAIRHSQGSISLPCDYSDKSSDQLHQHPPSRQTTIVDKKLETLSDRLGSHDVRTLRKDPGRNGLEDHDGVESENWRQMGKKSRKLKRGRKRAEEVGKTDEPTQRRGFCCALCNRKFSSKLTLCRHMGIHQGSRPFQCPHCPYSTRLKASLVQHLRVHTGEKPYRCSQCSYASIDSSSLRRHCRTHTQEKPYRCPACPYSSIQKKSLDLHARRHHTGESFPCHLCPYSSPDRQLLTRHLRKKHSTEQPPGLGPSSTKQPQN